MQRTHIMQRKRGRSGLTLLECLVSILILGIGVVGAVQTLNAAFLTITKANRIALATAMVREVLEEVNGQSVPGYKENEMIGHPEGTYTTGTSPAGNPYWLQELPLPDTELQQALPGCTQIVYIEDFNDPGNAALSNKLFTVSASIQWNNGNGAREVRLSTLSTNISFGR